MQFVQQLKGYKQFEIQINSHDFALTTIKLMRTLKNNLQYKLCKMSGTTVSLL